jgi:hypothetical protein
MWSLPTDHIRCSESDPEAVHVTLTRHWWNVPPPHRYASELAQYGRVPPATHTVPAKFRVLSARVAIVQAPPFRLAAFSVFWNRFFHEAADPRVCATLRIAFALIVVSIYFCAAPTCTYLGERTASCR